MKLRIIAFKWLFVLLASLFCHVAMPAADATFHVGVAKVDITPNYPVRLNGYYVRTNECTEVAQHIYAKALAIRSGDNSPALLISVDNCGVPASVRQRVLEHLAKKGITSDRLAICSSHTHSAPKLAGDLDTIFAMDLPAKEQAHVDRYTADLVQKIAKVALAALKKQKPARVLFGQTQAHIAINRRVPGGPVDNDVPVLQITDLRGKTRALVVNYACHATTLGGDFNKICGDWPGYTQEALEKKFPGAVALTLIGCGAECNPGQRGGLEVAVQNGNSLADTVTVSIAKGLQPLTQPIQCQSKQFVLAFEKTPTREEFEKRVNLPITTGFHARKNLERLAHGEKLPTHQPYFVQAWTFGDELTMLFLAGEVVGDYSLRAKEEFDRTRLWVNSYANDVPCYIPSQRVWKMQGYETVSSMYAYDKPASLNPHIEDDIFGVIHELVPTSFHISQQTLPGTEEKQKRHIYLLFGQSNMVGRGAIESQDRTPNTRVYELSSSNHWELALDPLHGVSGRAGVGPGLTFGKTMAQMDTNITICLVPCAVGSTLLERWERGGDLYSNAVARAKVAMQSGVLKGIVWHQGEQDSMTETNSQSYGARLRKMIGNIRADLNTPELPFVVGQIGEFLYTRKNQQTPFARMVNDALERIPKQVPHTACVSSKGLTHVGDEVHFDARSARELGKRYASAMNQVQQETARTP